MKTTALLALGLLLSGILGTASAAGDAAAGKEKSAMCQSCHGADGNSTDPQFPRLAGQHANYIERALMDYRSGARKNPIMAGFAGGLTDEDIANLAAYFSSQAGVVTPVQPREVNNNK
ncbi:MAG: cytochrome c [Gammaproteobacteria bacterium]|nr:cytochrome c [Gammaproteobacteria bacterium]